jgi:hypothetical protein
MHLAWRGVGVGVAVAAALAGCATRSVDVQPAPADPAEFAAWPCDALHDELDRVQRRAADVAYAVDTQLGNNVIALGLGVTVFWPALLAMRPDGPDAAELSRLKGRDEALRAAAATRACPPPADVPTPAQVAALPLRVGARLVYEERAGPRAAPQEFGLRLSAMRRSQLEFVPDLGGKALNLAWVQDLSGNVLPMAPGPAPVHWMRLLERDMALGQVVDGELRSATGGIARVRGQVIALGVRSVGDWAFDGAVVELFGEVLGDAGGGRVEGVMVIDRHTGILLRLELRSAVGEFALRRTLSRIDPAP